jgi:hypothetical protein
MLRIGVRQHREAAKVNSRGSPRSGTPGAGASLRSHRAAVQAASKDGRPEATDPQIPSLVEPHHSIILICPSTSRGSTSGIARLTKSAWHRDQPRVHMNDTGVDRETLGGFFQTLEVPPMHKHRQSVFEIELPFIDLDNLRVSQKWLYVPREGWIPQPSCRFRFLDSLWRPPKSGV